MSPGPTLCGSASPMGSLAAFHQPRSPASGDYPPAMDQREPPYASISGSPACRVAERADLPEPPGSSRSRQSVHHRAPLPAPRRTVDASLVSQDARDNTSGRRSGEKLSGAALVEGEWPGCVREAIDEFVGFVFALALQNLRCAQTS